MIASSHDGPGGHLSYLWRQPATGPAVVHGQPEQERPAGPGGPGAEEVTCHIG